MDPFTSLSLAVGVFLTVALLFGAALTVSARPLVGAASAHASLRGRPNTRFVVTLSALAQPGDAGERDGLRAWLTQAGLSGSRSVELYLASRAGLAMVLPIVGWALFRPHGVLLLAVIIVGVALGYYLPTMGVTLRRRRRQRLLRNAFPNALDMLVSCLEAGLGLDIALRHVARELGSAAPEFSQELSLVNTELGTGVARAVALRHFHERTDLEEVGSLVNELTQAERYGSRIAEALRAHALLTRARRLLESERLACEASPKLTVVMILFVLPPLFIVVLGPTAVNLIDRFLPMLGQG